MCAAAVRYAHCHRLKQLLNAIMATSCSRDMPQCCLIKQVIICFDAPLVGAISIILMNVCARGGETSPRFIWMGGFTPCTSLRAVHGATHGWHVSDVPLPMQHADTPQVVGTCHGMSPKVMLMRVLRQQTCHGMSLLRCVHSLS